MKKLIALVLIVSSLLAAFELSKWRAVGHHPQAMPAAGIPSKVAEASTASLESAPALSAPEWSAVQRQIEEEQRAFARGPDGTWVSFNAAGGERLLVHPDGGARFRLCGDKNVADFGAGRDEVEAVAKVGGDDRPDVSLTLKTVSLGRGAAPPRLVEAGAAAPVEKHRLERSWRAEDGSAVTEWWRSEARGFELGWNVAAKPSGSGPLVLTAAMDCPWPASSADNGRALTFAAANGGPWQLRCEGLRAWDANGRDLPAQMAAAGGSLNITVDDTDAAYPVVIDPWLLGRSLLFAKASDPTTDARFGAQLAACGDLLVVGATVPGGNGPFDGSTYIVEREALGFVVRRKFIFTPTLDNPLVGRHMAVCGETVAIGPVQTLAGPKVFICERNSGGPSAFGTVAEIPFGDADLLNSISLSGELLAVPFTNAAPGGLQGAGEVRVYRRDAGGPSVWGQVATLNAGDLAKMDGAFGVSTVLAGETLVTFAIVPGTFFAGFVFEKMAADGSTWQRTKVIQFNGLNFAFPSAALNGDTLAVALYLQSTGEVRLFERDEGGSDQWGLVKAITGPINESSFGYSMALEGALLAVSAPSEDVDHDNNANTAKISDAGVVRVFARDIGGANGWGISQTLTPGLSAEPDGNYGEGLAFAGGLLAIGIPKGDTTLPNVADAGTVGTFRLLAGQWNSNTLPANPQNGSDWGAAVAVESPYVVVGAPNYMTLVGDVGAAFVFRDGTLVASLFASNQQSGARFGAAVAINRGRIAVGAPLRSGNINNLNYNDLGSVYLFERNQGAAESWDGVKTLVPASLNMSSASPKFGSSVALAGDVLAVGAPEETALSLPGTNVRGRVKVHSRNQGGANNWGQVRSLTGDDNGSEEMLGTSVALDGDTLVAGAPLEAVNGAIRSGAAYVFRRNKNGANMWGRVTKLTQPTPLGDSYFGHSVSLHGDDAVIGAPHEDHGLEANVGAAYFFANGRTTYDTWTLTKRLQPDEVGTEARCGTAVGISHGLAILTATDPLGLASARLFVLSRNNGGPDQWGTIFSTTSGTENYGLGAAIDGTHLAVGDPLFDTTINNVLQVNRGRAIEFTLSWVEWAGEATRAAGPAAARLGAALALHGDWLVIGAPDEDVVAAIDAGAAYVFQRDRPEAGAWGLVQRLVDVQNNVANTRFGAALALDSQWLMVGVPGAHRAQTYYRQDQNVPQNLPWVDSVSLTAGGQPNAFGSSLAMESGVVIVGAPLHDPPGQIDAGAVFVFERNIGGANLWGLVKQLTAVDAGAGDAFGTSLALSAGRAVVGAPLDNNAEGTDAGAVYLFVRHQGGADQWSETAKILHNSQAAGDEMGAAVALRDDFLLAGLPKADPPSGSNSGRVLLFERNAGGADAWGLVKNLTAPAGTSPSGFGTAVAIDADHAIVGAPFADPRDLANAGEVHVFSRHWGGPDEWGALQTLAPTEATVGAQFGTALALDGPTFAVGAPGDATTGRGHVYVLRGRKLYDDWAVAHGLEGAWAAPAADADGDGQTNLVELVLGGHPRHGDSLGRQSLEHSGNVLTLTAHKACPCNVLVTLGAEVSTDLQSWQPADPGDIIEDNSESLRLQLTTTLGLAKFIRFRATLP